MCEIVVTPRHYHAFKPLDAKDPMHGHDWVADNLDDLPVGRFMSHGNADAWSAPWSSWDEERRGEAGTW
jgi:hypothetical protein